jgi:histidine ammonia-lyase
MPILDGERLTLAEVSKVAEDRESVSIAPAAVEKMLRSRAVIERLEKGGSPVYGVNTGVGRLADVQIPPEDLEQLQRNIVRSHACGVGEPLGRAEVRAILLIRANVLAKGFSGIRPVVAERLCDLRWPAPASRLSPWRRKKAFRS